MTMREVSITVRDGTRIGAAIYAPEGSGRFPALLAASPYRYDNNVLPAGPQFLWRETGPIDFYVKHGYAYVHMDVRGSGKSGGQFEFLGPNEQHDLYDAIQWIAGQPWSNGKVGGLGQSYFCMSQWWMGIMAPPALACLGAYDGLNDPYRASCYQGGIPGQFIPGYWWNQNRIINRYPASGAEPCVQETDLDALVTAHPTYDDFWRTRSASERLHEIKVPLYSVGIWGKVDL
ncbi:MAG: CocE/NonD family hydrolase, partial [Betaproteobacteria bacterium]